MEEPEFHWTALPPLTLQGLDSELVESLDYYMLRMAYTTGWSESQLTEMLRQGEGAGAPKRQLRFYHTDDHTEALISRLEHLTGVSHLRYGTFWVMRNVISHRAVGGWASSTRRWCPLCYKHWDPDVDWEPLAWSIPFVHRCPRHGCVLISNCRSCGAEQLRSVSLPMRRTCRRCKTALSGNGTFIEQPKLFLWVERQVLGLVKLCATPGRQAVSSDVLSELRDKFWSRASEWRGWDDVVRSIGAPRQSSEPNPLTLRVLINLSALHGVSIVDLVTRPNETLGEPLLDLWKGFHWISDPFVGGNDPVKLACWVARRLLSRHTLYFPSVRDLTKDFNVSPARLRDFNPEVYESYLKAYQGQGGPSARYARGKAFAATRKRLDGMDIKSYRPRLLWWLPREIEKEANVSQGDAFRGYSTAVNYLHLLAMARNHSLMLSAAKNDVRWLEGAGE